MSCLLIVARTLCAAPLLLLFALQPALAQEGQTTFKDQSRIAAIGGSLTEIVYALGEEGKLVARDSTSVYPADALKLPDVGYLRQLSPEGVLSVNPSGILALQGSGPKEAIDVLKKASVAYIEVPETFDHAGILSKIHAVGAAFGVAAKADALASEVDAQLKSAEALTAGVKERKRVLFILSLQGGKILASGGRTAADGIIGLAGAINAVDGFAGYKQLSDEAVIDARPNIILMMSRGGGHEAVLDDVLANQALASTPAGQARNIVRVDGNYMLGFGPRTAEAIRDLAVALYGDEIKD